MKLTQDRVSSFSYFSWLRANYPGLYEYVEENPRFKEETISGYLRYLGYDREDFDIVENGKIIEEPMTSPSDEDFLQLFGM